jgi:hypothetical protein
MSRETVDFDVIRGKRTRSTWTGWIIYKNIKAGKLSSRPLYFGLHALLSE